MITLAERFSFGQGLNAIVWSKLQSFNQYSFIQNLIDCLQVILHQNEIHLHIGTCITCTLTNGVHITMRWIFQIGTWWDNLDTCWKTHCPTLPYDLITKDPRWVNYIQHRSGIHLELIDMLFCLLTLGFDKIPELWICFDHYTAFHLSYAVGNAHQNSAEL